MSTSSDLPTLRWGIIGTGLISSWFVSDLLLPSRPSPRANHIIQAIGSSSLEKGRTFASSHASSASPKIYASYAEVYSDPEVDIVYLGTPHAFHKQNCLDAIAKGKNVLCEKAFTITTKEAEEVLAAAKAKGVFVMEAMWTRFYPLTQTLQKLLHEEKVIGDIHRTFCDFGLDMNIASLGPESRLKNPKLGAGSLLDIGIYSLMWGSVTLDPGVGEKAEMPKILAAQKIVDDVDITSSIILQYPSTGRQGILTSTQEYKTEREFCRIEGSKGSVIIEGPGASSPDAFTVYAENEGSSKGEPKDSGEGGAKKGKRYDFEKPGFGFYWEADAVALDIKAGKKESSVMPWAETIRFMKIMGECRRQGGARFPQDDE